MADLMSRESRQRERESRQRERSSIIVQTLAAQSRVRARQGRVHWAWVVQYYHLFVCK